MDYTSQYKKFVEYLEQDKFKNYIYGLNLYYNQSSKQICPVCNKIGINKKIDDNGDISMKCVHDCGWSMIIKRAKYENLYEEKVEEQHKLLDLKYTLLSVEKFNESKKDFLETKDNLDNINNLFDFQTKNKEEDIKKKFDLFNNLVSTYYDKKRIYGKISSPIDGKKRNSLLKIYHTEKGNLSDVRMTQISKQLGIPFADVKNWFIWLVICKKYIELQLEFNKILSEMRENDILNHNINDEFLIQEPDVIEKKEIKIKKIDMGKIPTSGDKKIKIKVSKNKY